MNATKMWVLMMVPADPDEYYGEAVGVYTTPEAARAVLPDAGWYQVNAGLDRWYTPGMSLVPVGVDVAPQAQPRCTHPGPGCCEGLMTQPADPPDLAVLAEADSPAVWVGALVRLKGNPPGPDRIGTVRRIDQYGWAVVDGWYTNREERAYPLSALERIQIVVLP